MNRFNKLICYLIMPLIAIFAFAGCGGKARTGDDIKNRYIAMKIRHSDMFEGGEFDSSINYSDEANKDILKDSVKVCYNESMTLGLQEIIREFSDTEEFKFKNDMNLYKRYFAMKELQDNVLENIFVYYNAYSMDFYANAELKGISKGEMRKLYNSVERLQGDLSDFKVARDKLQSACDVLTFSGVIRSDVTEYAYHYNMLIEDCLKFVRYFKELNEKYYFSAPLTEESTDEDKVRIATYYYNEATFELADMMYNVYLKSLNHINECDLSSLVKIEDRWKSTSGGVKIPVSIASIKQVYGTDSLYDVLGSKLNNQITKIQYVDPLVIGLSVDGRLDNFLDVRNVYLQKKRVYKVVIDRMEYYQFAIEKLGDQADYDAYYGKLSNLEQANINLVLNFYGTTLSDYVNALVGTRSLV